MKSLNTENMYCERDDILYKQDMRLTTMNERNADGLTKISDP